MSWLLWRQHRMQAAVAGGLLAVLGLLLWPTGVSMAHTYRSALTACRASDSCDQLNLFQGKAWLVDLVSFTVLIPILVGVFWGATVVGRELETGANRLVWTQSVTRTVWLRSKILLLIASSAAVGALLSTFVTLWSGTLNSYHQNRFDGLQFDIQGLAPVGYTIFAAALGLSSGILWRRTLPAIATTAGGFFVVRLVVESFLRPHFEHAVTVVAALTGGPKAPPGAWLISAEPTLNGHAVAGNFIHLPAGCPPGVDRASSAVCLTKAGYRMVTTYQPASRYWTFQVIEASIFVGLAALLVLVAVVALRRQDA